MVYGLVLERMWMTKAVQRIVMSSSCSRLSETSFSIFGRQCQDNVLFETKLGPEAFGWLVGKPEAIRTSRTKPQLLKNRDYTN